MMLKILHVKKEKFQLLKNSEKKIKSKWCQNCIKKVLTLNVNLSISIPIKLSEKIFGCITLLLNNNSYVIRDAYRNTDRITSPEKNPQRVHNSSMVK